MNERCSNESSQLQWVICSQTSTKLNGLAQNTQPQDEFSVWQVIGRNELTPHIQTAHGKTMMNYQ